jgi:hypothetical protein
VPGINAAPGTIVLSQSILTHPIEARRCSCKQVFYNNKPGVGDKTQYPGYRVMLIARC